MRQVVVGVFDRYEAARRAAATLQDSGFGPEAVQVTDVDESAPEAAAVAGETASAETGGVMARVRSFFAEVFGSDEHEHVSQYAEAVRRGGAVVKVEVEDESRVDVARDALQAAGAANIEEKVAEWRQAGWQPSASSVGATGAMAAGRSSSGSASLAGEDVIPVVREDVAVGKREVETGGVRVYARTVERPVSESVDLREEHAKVERRPVDRPATGADLSGLQERTVEVRETAERPVVQKTARVVEEVVVGKETTHRTETVQDTVRETEVDVQSLAGGSATGRRFEDDEPAFRQNYESQYGSLGGSYNDYAPAYRYGHSLAEDPRYSGKTWIDIEGSARSDWERSHPQGAWEKFKDAVRHAFGR